MTQRLVVALALHLSVASPDGTFWCTELNKLGAGTDKRGRFGEEAQQHVNEIAFENRS